MDLNDVRNKAFALYKQTITKSAFKTTDYWKVGCIFDTLTDYLQQDATFLTGRKVAPETVRKFMSDTYDRYQKMVIQTQPNYSWYDDFAWWGIACSKAFWPAARPEFDIFGDLRGRYQQICLATWETMKNGKYDHLHFGAPNVWAKCDQVTFRACAPKIAGGVWQYDIFGNPRQFEDTDNNPCTPIEIQPRQQVTYEFGSGSNKVSTKINLPKYDPVLLGPVQNTVVNGLYFVLANRLIALKFEDPKTADGIFEFFHSWFELLDEPRLYQEVAGGRLIRERVSAYAAKGSRVVGWQPENSWGGDQGLLLGALADYRRQQIGPPKINFDWWLNEIMGGVAGSMLKTENDHTYMMPWFPTTAFNWFERTDAGDYASGIGVYMRYLNYAYSFDPAVQKALKEDANPMRVLIFNSAQTVMADKLPSWGGGVFDYFNQLAILVMAISLLR